MNTIEKDIKTMICNYSNAGHIPGEIAQELLQSASIKTIEKNQIIHDVGDELNFVYYICSGLMRSYYIDYQGNDVTYFFMRENDFCCSELIIQDGPSFSCYEALADCRLLCIPIGELRSLLTNSAFCKNIYIKILEKVVLYKLERERGFLMKTATERYLDFLRENKDIEKRIQQIHLASFLGITPTSLSRIRRTLKKEKRQVLEKNRVYIS